MNHDRHARHVAARFSAAASTYGEVAQLQRDVARRVVALLPDHADPATILDAGCGEGMVARLCRERWPAAAITGVDIAPGMIAQARADFAGDDLSRFVVADLMHYQPELRFDLIVSSSALHWLRPMDRGLRRVAAMCAPGGMVAAAIMLNGSLGELHAARQAVAPGKTVAGKLPEFDDVEHAARMIPGARVLHIEKSSREVDFPGTRAFLRALNESGVTGGDLATGDAPLTRGELNALTAWYDLHCSSPRGVKATYLVGFLLLEC